MKITPEIRKRINQVLITLFWLTMLVTLILNIMSLICADEMPDNMKVINSNLNSLETIISEAGDVI